MQQPNQNATTPPDNGGGDVFQMLWDCRFCGTKKLLGVDHRHCPNCGAAQDPEWRYFPSEADKKTVTDPHYTYAGVDKICPFCQQPNSAAANFCKACGGDLANSKTAVLKVTVSTELGQDVAGIADDVVKQRFEKDLAPAKKGLSRRVMAIIAVIMSACIGLCGGALGLSNSTYDSKLNVTNMSWERTISIDRYESQQGSDWRNEVPSGAYNRNCYSKDRPRQESYQEACGVERVDRGDGSFSQKTKMCTRSRTVYESDTFCTYSIDRWIHNRDLKTSGGPNEAVMWANFAPALTSGLGAEREAGRTETYKVDFQATDNAKNTYTYEPDTDAIWSTFKVGQQYSVKINRLEIPQWDTLKLLAPR
jgi:hypothetical protein